MILRRSCSALESASERMRVNIDSRTTWSASEVQRIGILKEVDEGFWCRRVADRLQGAQQVQEAGRKRKGKEGRAG